MNGLIGIVVDQSDRYSPKLTSRKTAGTSLPSLSITITAQCMTNICLDLPIPPRARPRTPLLPLEFILEHDSSSENDSTTKRVDSSIKIAFVLD